MKQLASHQEVDLGANVKIRSSLTDLTSSFGQATLIFYLSNFFVLLGPSGDFLLQCKAMPCATPTREGGPPDRREGARAICCCLHSAAATAAQVVFAVIKEASFHFSPCLLNQNIFYDGS